MNSDSDSGYLKDYLDFDIEIREGEPRGYAVAVRSPAGEALEVMRFPFDERQLRDRLKDLEIALLRSGGTRRALSTEERTVQEFGQSLFEAVLVGKVGTCYYRSMDQAQQQGKGLRLKLHVKPPNLTVLPWEFLYDPDRDEYLCFSRDTPIVRYTDLRQSISRLIVAPPLRILGMVASPRDLDPLDVEHEKGLMDEAVGDLQADGLVHLTWLEGETWRDLQRAMRRDGPWHIFHFVGHGDFDLAAQEGLIAFAEKGTGRRHLLRSRDLARLLDGHPSLRLVFLNSCEGARGSEGDPFSGTAATLVRRGIPAVVAMQYQITDQAAIEFSSAFYESLADGLPVDAAVTEARVAVSMDSMLEWGTPVLYMRSPDGRLFDISIEAYHADVPIEIPGQEQALRQYREEVESVWADRQLNGSEVGWLEEQIKELGLNESAAAAIERGVMGDTKQAILGHQGQATKEKAAAHRYRRAVEEAWADNQVSEAEATRLRDLASEPSLSADTVAAIEREVMGDTIEAILGRQEESERDVAAVYAEGQRHMDAEEWQQAIDCFEEVQHLQANYRDTEWLLNWVRRRLATETRGEREQASQAEADSNLQRQIQQQSQQSAENSYAQSIGSLKSQIQNYREQLEQYSEQLPDGDTKAQIQEMTDYYYELEGSIDQTAQTLGIEDQVNEEAQNTIRAIAEFAQRVQDAAGQIPRTPGSGQQPNATQSAQMKAQELGVDLNQVQGTGAEGRITVKDVVTATGSQQVQQQSQEEQALQEARNFFGQSMGRIKGQMQSDSAQLQDHLQQLAPDARAQVQEMTNFYAQFENSINQAAQDAGVQDTLEESAQQSRPDTDVATRHHSTDVVAFQGNLVGQMAESLPEGYEALGQPFTDEQGNTILQAQDEEGDIVIVRRETDDEGNVVDRVYDAQGNLMDERIVPEPITGGEEDTGQDEMENQAEEHVQQAAGLHQQPNATEAAQMKAQELGVDLNQVQGTGAEGRLTVRDIIASEQPGSSGANQFRRTAPKPDQHRTWWQFWFE